MHLKGHGRSERAGEHATVRARDVLHWSRGYRRARDAKARAARAREGGCACALHVISESTRLLRKATFRRRVKIQRVL